MNQLFKKFKLFSIIVVLSLLISGCDNKNENKNKCDGIPEGKVILPLDDSNHEESMEWWYWTGHLKTEEGRWFGFFQVFFLIKMGTDTVMQLTNHSISDIENKSFHYNSAMTMDSYTKVPNGYKFEIEDIKGEGGNGVDKIHGAADEYILDLTLTATKAPVFQHENGYTDYPTEGYTYYYSRERMSAVGKIEIGDEILQVTGTAWFDHQWGELMPVAQKGWDWFAIQLDDNREIMIFVVRDGDKRFLAGGSLSDADCNSREIAPEDIEIISKDEWTSDDSDCTYPQNWHIKVEDLELDIDVAFQKQELVSIHETYWEGAATVSGDAAGRAYIELVGYCN